MRTMLFAYIFVDFYERQEVYNPGWRAAPPVTPYLTRRDANTGSDFPKKALVVSCVALLLLSECASLYSSSQKWQPAHERDQAGAKELSKSTWKASVASAKQGVFRNDALCPVQLNLIAAKQVVFRNDALCPVQLKLADALEMQMKPEVCPPKFNERRTSSLFFLVASVPSYIIFSNRLFFHHQPLQWGKYIRK